MKKWNNNNRDNNRAPVTDEKVFRGTRVEVRNNDINYALRKLKKVLDRDNFQRELAKHEYHEQPSIKRRRARAAARKRWEKQVEVLKATGRWNENINRSSSTKNKVKHTPHPSKSKSNRGNKRGSGDSN